MRLIIPPHIDPDHPISTQEYAVYTTAINDMVEQLSGWINRKATGGYIYGPSRFGKSRAIKWFVRAELEVRFKSMVPLVVWIRQAEAHTNATEFWRELLICSKYEFASPGKKLKNAAEAKELFRQRMITLARAARSNYVVLMIDEAQGLTVREWHWLLGVQNVLDDDGYRLSVITVGTQQIGYQHDYLAKTGDAHIAARFMLQHAPFHGLRSPDEIEYLLNSYDQESEWPAGSGKSYLHYFAPESYRAGKRLAHCAGHIWQAMIDLLPPNLKHEKTIKKIEFPMKFVALAVEDVLFRLAEGSEWEDVTTLDAWTEMIHANGFTSHMGAIFNPA